MPRRRDNRRLPPSFHYTFIPERQYLGALLGYAAGSGENVITSVAEATGIPTGTDTGKVQPTIGYATAMGFVKVVKSPDDGIDRLELTELGRAIFLGDQFLLEELTQWIAHLNLCNVQTGAEIWYQLFWKGTAAFGKRFNYDECFNWLSAEIRVNDVTRAISPAFRMYQEKSSFLLCNAVVREGDSVVREEAPINENYALGYATWMAFLIERAGIKTGNQFTVDDLEEACGFRSVTGWSLADSQKVLSMIENRGVVSIDRHMQPWIVIFKQSASQLSTRIFEEFI